MSIFTLYLFQTMYSHHGFPEVVGSRTYLQTLTRVSEINAVQLNLTFMLSAVVVAIFIIIIICLLMLCK